MGKQEAQNWRCESRRRCQSNAIAGRGRKARDVGGLWKLGKRQCAFSLEPPEGMLPCRHLKSRKSHLTF